MTSTIFPPMFPYRKKRMVLRKEEEFGWWIGKMT